MTHKLANRLWPMRTEQALILLIALSLIPTACARQTPIPATDGGAAVNIGCLEFSRLTFSRLHDTEPTIAGIKAYDAARDKVCGVGK